MTEEPSRRNDERRGEQTGRRELGIWVERKIREAIENGDFDNLPGLGQPIPGLDGPDDGLWWVRKKLRGKELDEARTRTAPPRYPVRVMPT